MENIILTNNKDLRLVGVKVGVLSTLRFELPLVSASATHVEVIVTSGNVHSAYTATFIDATKRWQCDIAASQFPTVGKQSYEVAYVLDGKQFWDGKGWIEIENATTSGIEPQPRPEPYRYAVVSVNGYGADAEGAVRIPKTFITTDSPVTTEGYIEGDICFNRETGAMWTLCNVQGTPTWVFAYKNYYTKAETEEAIDKLAAYYITYDAAGNPFPTYAALANATTVYSGGAVRVPTRNDYCVVLADESHDGAEYRYIYAVAEGQTAGQWEPQYPIEGVMTVDQTVTKNSQNPVKSSGIWSAIWGALSALPTGFSSLYDWAVAQLAGKASKADATLTERGFTEWAIKHTPLTTEQEDAFYYENPLAAENDFAVTIDGTGLYVGSYNVANIILSNDKLSLKFIGGSSEARSVWGPSGTTVATRTALQGYRLGPDEQTNPNRDKPLASEAEAEALRTAVAGKQDALTSQQLANIAAVPDKLNKSGGTMTGSLTLYEPQNGAEIYFPSGGKAKLQFGSGLLNVDDTTGRVTINQKDAAVVDNIPYDRITITTGQLQNHAVQKVTLNAATTTLTLPALTDLTGKVSDFGIDVVNGYEVSGTPTAASFTLAGTIGTDYNLIVPEGEDWSEMSSLAAGEMAVYYFTLSAFQINDKPTWEVMKKVVTLVPVPVAP